MSEDESKAVIYETNIEDMLKAIYVRLEELDRDDLDEFEQGRKLAFTEVMEIIETRHQVIMDVLSDD